MKRGDRYRSQAAEAEALAADAPPEIRRPLLELAARWRTLGQHADETEAQMASWREVKGTA